jgi:hypothetical protein
MLPVHGIYKGTAFATRFDEKPFNFSEREFLRPSTSCRISSANDHGGAFRARIEFKQTRRVPPS